MSIPQKLFRLALRFQALHSWEIKVLYLGRTLPGQKGRWVIYIPAAGAKFEGGLRSAISWLQGYQAGYLSGRHYSREEAKALLDEAKSFIKERVVAEVAAARAGAS